MKKCISLIGAFVLMMSLCGCKAGSHDVYEEIYERYYNMKSFAALAEVTVRNDRTENVYLVNQKYLAPDGYLLEVAEPLTLKGSGFSAICGEMKIRSGFGQAEALKTGFADKRGVLFVSDFFEAYFKSEETTVSAASAKGEPMTVLECFLNSENEKRFMQKLWIDNKTFLPVKLETYDIDNNPAVTVVFNEFQRDCDIELNEFE